MRNFLHLSWIITLDNLKLNIDWHSVIVRISLVLYNFIKDRLTGKSSDLRLVLVNGQSSRPYSKIGRRLVLISSKITSSDAILPIHCLLKAWNAHFFHKSFLLSSSHSTCSTDFWPLRLASQSSEHTRFSYKFFHNFSAFLVLFARWNWLTASSWAHKI